jgi:hypothetical protein
MYCALHNFNYICGPWRTRMSYLKSKLHVPLLKYGPRYFPWIKYGLLAVCASIWLYALVDQLYTDAGTMKYLLMSLIMIAIAMI